MDVAGGEGIIARTAGALLLFGCTAGGADADPARALLERSLHAMQIPLEPGRGERLVFEARGVVNQGVENQGRRPGSLDPSPLRESFAVDVESGRLAYEYRHERYDGSVEWLRDLYEKDVRTIAVRHEGFAVRLQSRDFVAERESLWRRFPHVLLREAISTAESRRKVLSSHRVELDTTTGETLVLVLDEDSSLLSRVEYLTDVPSLGDAEIAWTYADYAPVEGLGLVPHRYGVSVAGRPFMEMRVERVGRDPSELLALPEGTEEPALRKLPEGRDASANARVETVGPGVHVVRDLRLGFHPLFVELADSIVAVDAPSGYPLLSQLPAGDVAPGPSSAWLAERYLELIEAAVPGKPVRYVVLTHFHNDHAGGLRAFVARGATVVASASIREAVEDFVAAPHTVAPDALAASPRELRFEAVEESITLGDERRSIEVIEAGSNPHTDSMLVVHVPGEGIVFASDLLEPWELDDSSAHEPGVLDRFFVDWLSDRGLAPERVFSMHAPAPATREHLERLRRTQGDPS